MKDIKGRILKQLKSISQVPYLKHHDEAPSPHASPRRILGDLLVVHSANLIRNLKEDDEGSDLVGSSPSSCDKENYRPPPPKGDAFMDSDVKVDCGERYRRPDPESETLFDPELLAAFREAVTEHMRGFEEYKRRARARVDDLIERNGERDPPQVSEAEPPAKLPRTDDSSSAAATAAAAAAALNPLLEFEYRCPPSGEESVILYTTTLRGIRKTFEDCSGVRFLLQSLKIRFFERDVSMHLAFRKELWEALEGRAIPPRLFILGRYIGGADEVLGLHEQGRLLPLLQGVPTDQSAMDGAAGACRGCTGVKFVVCWECSGSRKVHGEEELGATRCQRCNENGLVLCPICC